MKRILSLFVTCLLLILNLAICNTVSGGGFDNPVVGIKAIGMSYAFTGIADEPSAVYWNPGGLAFQEQGPWHFETSATFCFTNLHYKANAIDDQSDDVFPLPGFFISKTFEKWAFGFGGYIPYAGGGASYDNFQGSPFKLESAAGWNALTGAVAYKLSPNLSIGGGGSLYIGEMTSKFFDPTLGGMVENKYKGYSGYGGHLGLFYKPMEELGIGLVVRSEVPIEMEGTVSTPATDMDSEVEFTLPYYLVLGFGYKPVRDLTLGFSVTYQMWGDLDSLTFTTANISANQLTYYKDSMFFCLGLEYLIAKNIAIRTGVNYRQTSTEARGMTPLSGDVNMISVPVGIAFSITDSIELNCTVLQNFGQEETYQFQKFDQDGTFIMIGCRLKI